MDTEPAAELRKEFNQSAGEGGTENKAFGYRFSADEGHNAFSETKEQTPVTESGYDSYTHGRRALARSTR